MSFPLPGFPTWVSASRLKSFTPKFRYFLKGATRLSLNGSKPNAFAVDSTSIAGISIVAFKVFSASTDTVTETVMFGPI